MKVRQLTSGDLRALVTLLILLPCIPAALLFRFVRETIQWQRIEAGDLLQDRLQDVLLKDLDQLETTESTVPGIAARIEEFLRRKLPSDIGIALSGTDQHLYAGEQPPSSAVIVLEHNIPRTSLKLLLFNRRAPPPVLDPFTLAVFGGISAVVLAISLTAGYAVHRRISLADMRTSLLASVSHDLKMPLASSRLLAETLLDQPASAPPERTSQYLKLLLSQNETLARRVDSLLIASQIRGGRLDFSPGKLDPHVLAAGLRETFPLDTAPGSLRIHVDAHCPPIRGDDEAIPILLNAIVDNAITHSNPPGEVTVRFTPAQFKRVLITVEDNGPGIPRQGRMKLLKPFTRGDSRLDAPASHGMGLGLWIASTITRTHRGRLDIEDRKGGGTRVAIQLPAFPEQPRDSEA